MNKATLAVLVAGLTFCVAVSSAPAQGDAGAASEQPSAAPEGGHEMRAAKLKEKLGLTDDQAAKLDAAWKSAKDAAKPYRDQLKADMKKLREQVKSQASDDDIKATLDDAAAARKGLRDAMQKAQDDTRSILTPMQQAKLALGLQRRIQRARKAMRGHGGGQGPAQQPVPAQ